MYKVTPGTRQMLCLMRTWPVISFQASARREFRGNLKRPFDR